MSKQSYFKQDVEQCVQKFLNVLMLGAIRKKCLSKRGSQSYLLTRWLMKETSNYGGLSLLSHTHTHTHTQRYATPVWGLSVGKTAVLFHYSKKHVGYNNKKSS